MRRAIEQEIRSVVIFLAVLWVVWGVDFLLPIDLTQLGLLPRTLNGLIGIPLMPFLHGGLGHLISNTIPLAILLMLLAGSRASSWRAVAEIIVLGGGLLWLLGRSSIHVGASGLVYGLIAFLIASGYFERRLVSVVIALVVLFLYGGTLLFGVLPTSEAQVSWDGHLFGAMAGGLVAYIHTRPEQPESARNVTRSNISG
jgi:membrane associated rhomboid family serine protease